MVSGHLQPSELARLALGGAPDAHVESCPQCTEGLRVFHGLFDQLRALPEPPEHLIEAATTYFGKRQRLDGLIERLAEDPALRKRAGSNPQAVLAEAGLDPLPELLEALREPVRRSDDVRRRIAAKRLWF